MSRARSIHSDLSIEIDKSAPGLSNLIVTNVDLRSYTVLDIVSLNPHVQLKAPRSIHCSRHSHIVTHLM